ncbi:MAG: tetratricopeptide repeat protein [Muribaculaceae bacterium]|nr:tetratricopeptide repeat protein [Muribaculaceae bacterium]
MLQVSTVQYFKVIALHNSDKNQEARNEMQEPRTKHQAPFEGRLSAIMRVRRIVICLAASVLACALAAASPLTDRATQAYNQELYTEALQLYQQAERQEGASAALYVNMGDTYYRLKDTGRAILCYERALLLDPGNGDARYNLDFVRQKAGLPDESGASILSIWANRLLSSCSSNTWAVLAIAAFILCLLAVVLYVFSSRVVLRKVGFFGAIALLALTVPANVGAFVTHNRATRHNTAIVMAEKATLGTSPRTPAGTGEIAFELPAGRKVQLGDTVRVGQNLWLRATTPDGRQAWINAQDVEVI